MLLNNLRLNNDKTELLVLHAKHRPKPASDSIAVGDATFFFGRDKFVLLLLALQGIWSPSLLASFISASKARRKMPSLLELIHQQDHVTLNKN